jgi:hypothetical protein
LEREGPWNPEKMWNLLDKRYKKELATKRPFQNPLLFQIAVSIYLSLKGTVQ